MKIKCPICGAKLLNNQVCQYCNVTDEQVLGASNKKVKEFRKTGNTDMIHTTTIFPFDLVKWKMVVFTILLGWAGAHHFYTNRPIRGAYSIVSTVGFIIVLILSFVIKIEGSWVYIAFNIIYEIFGYMMAINVILWLWDIIAVLIRTYKYPVVLPKKE